MADLKTELQRRSEQHAAMAARAPRLGREGVDFTVNEVMTALVALIINGAKAEAFREAAELCDRFKQTERGSRRGHG